MTENNQNNTDEIYGLPKDVLQCGLERTEELNNRMSNRNIPSQPLAPQFSLRPASTKYAMMPILDNRVVLPVPPDCQQTYQQSDGHRVHDLDGLYAPGQTTGLHSWSRRRAPGKPA